MSGVTSVRRALRIMETLATSDGGVALSDVAATVDLALSTTHNLLKTLVDAGYAVNDRGTYRLGPRAAGLASDAGESLQQSVQRTTAQVSRDTGHSTIAVVLADGRPQEIAHSRGDDLVTVNQPPATNSSVLDLATGRLLIAYEDPKTWPTYVKNHAGETQWTPERWQEVFELFRTGGIGLRQPQTERIDRFSVTGAAVPVWHRPGRPAWALGCTVPGPLSLEELHHLVEVLRRSAQSLTESLGLASFPVGQPTRKSLTLLRRMTAETRRGSSR